MVGSVKKYEKFILPELSRALVVNPYDQQDIMDNQQDDLITDAITQHLSTIVGETGADDGLPVDHKTERMGITDLEQIKIEHYNRGLTEAKEQYEAAISDLKSESDLAALLRERLENLAPAFKVDEEMIKLSAEMIANIAKKVYLVLPVNFERMLKETMIDRLKKMYREGDVTLTVNPARLQFCEEILKIEDLPEQMRERIRIVADENFGKDDCSLVLEDTRFEYNQEQLSFEINQILEQLRQ